MCFTAWLETFSFEFCAENRFSILLAAGVLRGAVLVHFLLFDRHERAPVAHMDIESMRRGFGSARAPGRPFAAPALNGFSWTSVGQGRREFYDVFARVSGFKEG